MASLTFTSDLALKQSPEVSLTTFLNYSQRQLSWSDSNIVTSISTTVDPCGPFTHELYDISSGSIIDLTTLGPFTFDSTQQTKVLNVQTSDAADIGIHTLRLVVYY